VFSKRHGKHISNVPLTKLIRRLVLIYVRRPYPTDKDERIELACAERSWDTKSSLKIYGCRSSERIENTLLVGQTRREADSEGIAQVSPEKAINSTSISLAVLLLLK